MLGALTAFLVDLTSFVKPPLPMMLLYTQLAFLFATALGSVFRALSQRLERNKRP